MREGVREEGREGNGEEEGRAGKSKCQHQYRHHQPEQRGGGGGTEEASE